jgi:hypothetical protein
LVSFPPKPLTPAILPPPLPDFLISGVQKLRKICEASGKREIVGRVYVKKITAKYKQGSDIANDKTPTFFAKILRKRY